MSDAIESILNQLMHEADYDPAERKRRYELTKELKGRKKGSAIKPAGERLSKDAPSTNPRKTGSKLDRVGGNKTKEVKSVKPAKKEIPKSLKLKIDSIKGRLVELNARLRELQASANKTAKDAGSSSAAEKSQAARDSKAYREKNKAKIAEKAKASSESKPKGISGMNQEEVKAAINKAERRLGEAMALARSKLKGG